MTEPAVASPEGPAPGGATAPTEAGDAVATTLRLDPSPLARAMPDRRVVVLDTTFPHAKPQMLYWNVNSEIDGEATIQARHGGAYKFTRGGDVSCGDYEDGLPPGPRWMVASGKAFPLPTGGVRGMRA